MITITLKFEDEHIQQSYSFPNNLKAYSAAFKKQSYHLQFHF